MKHVRKPGVYWAAFTQTGKDAVRVLVHVSGAAPLLQIDWAVHVGARQPLLYEQPNRLDVHFGKRVKIRPPAAPLFPAELCISSPGVYLASQHRRRKSARTVIVQVSDEPPMLQIDWAIVLGRRTPTVLKPLASELMFYKRLKVPDLARV